MRIIYTKPYLRDLSVGSRIAFVRQFRFMTQDDVSDKFNLTGEAKRRMTRYEKGDRLPKEDRLKEIADILNVNVNILKPYDSIDIVYTLMWLEELFPNYKINLNNFNKEERKNITFIREKIKEWEIYRTKRLNKEISYKEYIEWK